MKNNELYSEKKDCCGCGACFNACPKNAITMKKDEFGFVYPDIEQEKCIDCKACQKVCDFQNKKETNEVLQVYASARNDSSKIIKSASGGIFAAVAENVLNNGGVVFGASMEYEEGKLVTKHIKVDNIVDLEKLQGSKYVQSDIGNSYTLARQCLMEGKKVLFSGTPCQIAGLNGYLRKQYDNLITIDIICHGVPNQQFFQDYISYLETKIHGKIIDFKFRDKTKGWGLNAKVTYENSEGVKQEMIIPSGQSSYYKLFLKSLNYRENCYRCKYTCSSRPGDISIGDFWGIEHEHPEVLQENNGKLSDVKGISVIMLNTDIGISCLEQCKGNLDMYESTFESAARGNTQLREPSQYPQNREKLLDTYKKNGYEAVEKYYKKVYRMSVVKSRIAMLLPKSIKKILKAILYKIKR